MYHVTDAANVARILERGHEARLGPRASEIGEAEPLVYFFESFDMVEVAIEGWLGDAFEDAGAEERAVLEIDPAGLTLEHDGFSHTSPCLVPAGAIRLLRTEPME